MSNQSNRHGSWSRWVLTLSVVSGLATTGYFLKENVSVADDAYEALFSYEGIFKSSGECAKALPGQIDLFKQQTGLVPTSSACIPAENNPSLFSISIQASGSPTRRLYSMDSTTTFGQADNPDLIADLKKEILSAGGTLALEANGYVFYYNSGPIEVASLITSTYQTVADCQSRSQSMQSIYIAGGVPSAVATCVPVVTTSFAELIVMWQGENITISQDHSPADQVYPTLSVCQDAVPGALAQFQQANPKKVKAFGAMCETHVNSSAAFDGYFVDVYSNKDLITE